MNRLQPGKKKSTPAFRLEDNIFCPLIHSCPPFQQATLPHFHQEPNGSGGHSNILALESWCGLKSICFPGGKKGGINHSLGQKREKESVYLVETIWMFMDLEVFLEKWCPLLTSSIYLHVFSRTGSIAAVIKDKDAKFRRSAVNQHVFMTSFQNVWITSRCYFVISCALTWN